MADVARGRFANRLLADLPACFESVLGANSPHGASSQGKRILIARYYAGPPRGGKQSPAFVRQIACFCLDQEREKLLSPPGTQTGVNWFRRWCVLHQRAGKRR